MTATPTDTTPKFTPGPWTCFYKHKYDEWHVSLPMTGGNMKLALCPDGIQSENREADAHLIAAAPNLFHVLNGLIGLVQMVRNRPDCPYEIKRALADHYRLDDAFEALSKATPNSARGFSSAERRVETAPPSPSGTPLTGDA